MTASFAPDASPFDPDQHALAHGEVPPAPFACPTCRADVDDVAVKTKVPLCAASFQRLTAPGSPP